MVEYVIEFERDKVGTNPGLTTDGQAPVEAESPDDAEETFLASVNNPEEFEITAIRERVR